MAKILTVILGAGASHSINLDPQERTFNAQRKQIKMFEIEKILNWVNRRGFNESTR